MALFCHKNLRMTQIMRSSVPFCLLRVTDTVWHALYVLLRYDEYELRQTEIRISDVLLGEGAHGVVYKGTLIVSRRLTSGNAVTSADMTGEIAIKILHPHASDQARFVLTIRTL